VSRPLEEPRWLRGIAHQVQEQLARKSPDSPKDVYVWSDGTVTGPKDSDDREGSLRLVATFTPGEQLSDDSVLQTVRNGLATVPPENSPGATVTVPKEANAGA
jgi:hypothetical protein